jgi:hypothetical protein
MKVRWLFCLLLLGLAGCNLTDRGLAKLQVVEDLILGLPMDDIKHNWFLYSTKPMQVDQDMSDETAIVYRGVSRDRGVTGFYLYFNPKTKILEKAEWRYHSSMTAIKEKELVELWTKQLWPPSFHRRWDGRVYSWEDRRARLELYIADGICHLIQRLT